MKSSRWSLVLASAAGLVALTLLQAAPAPDGNTPAKDEPAFHAQLRTIAKNYKAEPFATPVDGHMPRWAPLLCRMPQAGQDYLPGKARISASKDAETHGQKMYFLYAKNQLAFLDVTNDKATPVGQFIVKESWIPEEMSDSASKPQGRYFETVPTVEKDGKKYKTGKLAGLYIMFKLSADTPNTDNGWVYGTLTADQKTVTAAGRVESCMSCHEKAAHDRLFGLPKEDVQRIKAFIEKTSKVK